MADRDASLRALIDAEAPLRAARAVQLALQMLEALQAVHEHGHAHGDVRPELVVLQNGRVSLLPSTKQASATAMNDVRGVAEILYELLTRTEPVSGMPVSRLTPAIVPQRLDDVMERALGLSRNGHFETAPAFAQELRVCLLDALGAARRRF
jgi:hypothetical protein